MPSIPTSMFFAVKSVGNDNSNFSLSSSSIDWHRDKYLRFAVPLIVNCNGAFLSYSFPMLSKLHRNLRTTVDRENLFSLQN